MKRFFASFTLAALVCSTALAGTASTASYEKANTKMHKQMDIRYTGNADVDFARGMIPHHQGAVDMAKTELKYGKDPEIRALAARIITWQEAEIGFMTQWLAGRDSTLTKTKETASTRDYKTAMEAMHHHMHIDYTGNADVDFARGMIPHHQGAIDMAWVLKTNGTDPALSKMADEVIRSQGQEIALMQEWLEKNTSTSKTKKKTHDHSHH